MALYKRLSQLQETDKVMPDDYLILDREEWGESKKIKKGNLLSNVLMKPDLEEAYPESIWGRQNGGWVQFSPDKYVMEANIDGKFYLRHNGGWVALEKDDSFTGIKIYGGYIVNTLPSGSDLDTFNTSDKMGFFQVLTLEEAETIKGAPTSKPFAIEIMSVGQGVRQEVTESGLTGKKWYRIFKEQWSPWYEIFTENPESYIKKIKTIKGRVY